MAEPGMMEMLKQARGLQKRMGKVQKKELHGDTTEATLQIDGRYAPLPADTSIASACP